MTFLSICATSPGDALSPVDDLAPAIRFDGGAL